MGIRKPVFSHIKMMPDAVFRSISVSFNSLTTSGLKKLLAALDEHGVAVVTGVLAPQEVASLETAFADDLRGIINLPEATKQSMPLCQDPLREWNTHTHPLSRKPKSIASDFGLPHGTCAWGVRLHPKVKKVYELLFQTEELCVGIDNVFFCPDGIPKTNSGILEDRLWPHADQNLHALPHGKYDSYQGVAYLWDADENSSATVVWPGSHRTVFPRLMEYKGKTTGKHFVTVRGRDVDRFAEEARRVPVPAGGLLLWNSKAIHQGWSHGRRLAVPVCFEPRARRSESALQSKVNFCFAGRSTTHWASIGKPRVGDMLGQGFSFKGGTADIPLVSRAHEHLIVDGKELDPRVMALL